MTYSKVMEPTHMAKYNYDAYTDNKILLKANPYMTRNPCHVN